MSTAALPGLRSSFQRMLRRGGTTDGEPTRSRDLLNQTDTVLYAVGDVHGCYDELRELEDMLLADGRQFAERKHIVMLGDYVDRGPDSARVLDHLLGALPADFARTCLCGNHDAEMLKFIEAPREDAHWLNLGGDATLRSYGLDVAWLRHLNKRDPPAIRDLLLGAIPAEHIEFLRTLPIMATADDIVFVHAGLRPGVALNEQTDNDLLWIRQPFLDAGPQLPVWVVHGHTPVLTPAIVHDRIGIDTAAFKTGRLTAIRIRQREVSLFQTAGGPAASI